MKLLRRDTLNPDLEQLLAQYSERVAAAPDLPSEAARLWDSKNEGAFRAIRDRLEGMASGLQRCMYCEDSVGTDIEHFWPKRRYPQRAFNWLNYLLACSGCNSNYKREDFPIDGDGQPLLIDPTAEDPRIHIVLSPRTGKYDHKSPKGEASIQVFGLYREVLVKGRRNAWTQVEAILAAYGRARDGGRMEDAQRCETAVREHPFASVLAHVLATFDSPGRELVGTDAQRAIESHAEIRSWL